MPNYSSSAIDPGKVALAVSKSTVGLTGPEVAMIEKVVPGVNGGYALGDITRDGSINVSDSIAWLRVETGTASQEELDRSYEIRREISRQYSLNRTTDLPILLMVDLDIDLIIKALEWWLEYGVFTNDFSWNVSSNPYADVMMAMSDSYSLNGGLKRSWHLIDWTGVTREQSIINNIAAWKQLYTVDVTSANIADGYNKSMFIVWQWWHYFGRNDNGFGVRNPAIARPTSIRSNRIRTLERTNVPSRTLISYEIIGGGGTGAGGYYGTGNGIAGNATSLYDSITQNVFAVSYGGAGGTQPAPYSGSFRTGERGEASYYGSGGQGGYNSDSNNQTAGFPAPSSSYGAGGGGGGAYPFSANNGGGGGRAANRETGAFAMVPNSVLNISVGAKGSGKPGGGNGAGGYVKLTINGVEYEYTSSGVYTLTIPESTSSGSSSVGAGEALTKVRSLWKPKFTTDFRYMKKDPNGQFVAGGLKRCPTFSGQSSSGYIPDDVNKGHALFSSYLDNTVLSPSSHQYSTPYVVFAKSFTSSAYTYKLRSKIIQEIRLPPSGGYSSGTFFLSSGIISNFTIKIRAFNLNWSNKTLASGTTTFNQTSFGTGQYGTISTNIILWPSFGILGYGTDANGRPIPPTPGEDVYYRITFASPIDQFIETDANGERWIRPCYIEQEIPGNWYTAPFEQSAIYSSNIYYSGGLKQAMADNTSWPTVDSEGKPIYIRLYHGFTASGQIFGNLPATNFDFAETV